MGSTRGAILFYCVALLSVVAVGSAAAPDGNNGRFISREVLSCSNVTESSHRKLQGGLPAAGVCPVQFEGMPGIRTVTSSCRSVHFSAQRCCGAFKNFACPYAELLNDESNGCASEMFFEIIVRGRLTPGLFSNLCREGALGLQCY